MNVSTFALGALAVTVFQLGFVDALLTIVFITMLGITPVAFFSTFGPRYGLRQMVLSRYFFGFYGVKVGKSVKNSMFDKSECSQHGRIQLQSLTSWPAWAGALSTSSLVRNCSMP